MLAVFVLVLGLLLGLGLDAPIVTIGGFVAAIVIGLISAELNDRRRRELPSDRARNGW